MTAAVAWLAVGALVVALCYGIKHYDRLEDDAGCRRAEARRRLLAELDRIYDEEADG